MWTGLFSIGLAKNGFWGKMDWVDKVVYFHDQILCFSEWHSLWFFFPSSIGLHQGDPLSPYLFMIAMESLSCFLKRAVAGGFLSGCQVKGRFGEGVQVSHLLFVDDTLVFCEASLDQITYLCWLLVWFEAISRLRINLEKSELIPVERVENLNVLLAERGCKV